MGVVGKKAQFICDLNTGFQYILTFTRSCKQAFFYQIFFKTINKLNFIIISTLFKMLKNSYT